MIKPTGDKVLVERYKPESITAGGILLPRKFQEKNNQGTVIATGEGREFEDGTVREIAVKVGEEILFTSDAGTPVLIEEKPYLIIPEKNILAVIE